MSCHSTLHVRSGCIIRVHVEWLLGWLLCLAATTKTKATPDFGCWKGVSGAVPCLGSGALLAFLMHGLRN